MTRDQLVTVLLCCVFLTFVFIFLFISLFYYCGTTKLSFLHIQTE